MLKEHGFPFKAAMVLAMLDDRKTQTRRVLSPRNACPSVGTWKTHDYDLSRAWPDQGLDTPGNQYLHVPYKRKDEPWENNPEDDTVARIRCRWKAGDRIWVQEALRSWGYDPTSTGTRYAATPEVRVQRQGPDGWQEVRWRWQSDSLPSIFMPRAYSRITHEIVSVRAQRLQEISDCDALCEGIYLFDTTPGIDVDIDGQWWPGRPRARFIDLWDSINGKTHPWDANDWVWALTFRRLA